MNETHWKKWQIDIFHIKSFSEKVNWQCFEETESANESRTCWCHQINKCKSNDHEESKEHRWETEIKRKSNDYHSSTWL